MRYAKINKRGSKVQFKDLDVKTKELILEFNRIEQREIDLLKEIKSPDKVKAEDLQELSNLLKREKIPLLNIVLGELKFVEEHYRGFKRIALREKYNLFLDILEKMDELSEAITVFLKRAEEDASKADEILRKIENRHQDFYLKRPGWNPKFEREIRGLAKDLGKDIKREKKLKVDDANKIIETYLRIARNKGNKRVKWILKLAKAGTTSGRIAACFLIVVIFWRSITYSNQPVPEHGYTIKHSQLLRKEE
jgi:hypothetical protein